MDLSSLESTARQLEALIDGLERVLFTFTALVVAGLVLEYWHDIAEFIEEWKRPAALFPWKKFMELSGGILVVIGVAGELGTQSCLSIEESAFRVNSHKVEGLLNDKAGFADQKAETARLAQEQLRAENLRLEAIIQPRSLTIEQQRAVGYALREFSGHKAEVASFTGDSEGYALCKQMIAALRYARFEVNDRTGGYPASAVPYTGISIEWPPGEEQLALRIQKAIKMVGHLRAVYLTPINMGNRVNLVEPIIIVVFPKPFDVLK
jgi:hypothetical protein